MLELERLHCRAPSALALLTVLVASGVAWSQQADGPLPRPKTLHEYFQPGRIQRARDADRSAPSRVKTRQVGEAPALTLNTRQDEPVMGSDGPLSDLELENPQGELNPQGATNKLDDKTDRVDELNYFSSFDPSVIPLKRGVAQNKVILDASGDYAFTVSSSRNTRVNVDPAPKRADEDSFWGTFLISAIPDTPTPIPSVSPDQRILKVLTEPAVEVRVMRDQADNHYLTTSHRGLVRVNILLAAPQYYFDGDFDEGVDWSDLPQSLVSPMPERAHTAAGRVLKALNVGRQQTPKAALLKLIAHFRGFEGKPFPDDLRGADVYESIALNSIGVCRHRSFAFVMTASALGIPSRYVYNEAHAFVEIYWPAKGWRRVDLGGAAEDVLMRAGEQQQRVHDGGTKDSLPQPPAYTQEMKRMADKEAKANAAAAKDGAIASDTAQNNATSDPAQAKNTANPDDPSSAALQGANVSTLPEVEDPRRPSTLALRIRAKSVLRGQDLNMSGQLGTSSGGLGMRQVRVVLVPVGASSAQDGARLLGQVVTNAQGRFELLARIPKDLPIGRWAIKAVFDGDDSVRPAESD